MFASEDHLLMHTKVTWCTVLTVVNGREFPDSLLGQNIYAVIALIELLNYVDFDVRIS